jgi:DNA-binding NtrC family response regulator
MQNTEAMLAFYRRSGNIRELQNFIERAVILTGATYLNYRRCRPSF